jgi:hypothetical protein
LKTPTPSEARSRGRKGGIASGKARREKKLFRETLDALLSMPMKEGKEVSVDDIKNFANIKGQNISVQEAILIAQIQKAMKGDTRAAEYVRDTIGQKPTDEVNIQGNMNMGNPYDELTVEELQALAKKCEADGNS